MARLQQLAGIALLHYGLGDARRTLLQYENNAVYRIDSPAGDELVLRIVAPAGRSAEELRSEMRWLSALRRDTDLAVPEPIPSLDGAPVTTVTAVDAPEPHHCVLVRWIPGEPPEPGIEPAVVERIGGFTARLHRHAESFVPPARFVRRPWDWERLFGPSSTLGDEAALAPLSPAQRDVLRAVSALVWRALDVPREGAFLGGLIHADLHRDNILVSHGEIGVIDFDDCGRGYYLFDVASTLDSFHRRVARTAEDYARLREAYLNGYARVRPLPAGLDAALGVFKAMRDMVNVSFILGSKNANVQAWGRPRLGAILDELRAYADGSPCRGI